MGTIGVFIICSDLPYFKAIERKLNENNIIVIGMCNTPNDALSLFQPEGTDMVIMDLYWSDMHISSTELTGKLRARKPAIKLIGVTRFFIKTAIHDLTSLKIPGYIPLNPYDIQRVVECILDIYGGNTHL